MASFWKSESKISVLRIERDFQKAQTKHDILSMYNLLNHCMISFESEFIVSCPKVTMHRSCRLFVSTKKNLFHVRMHNDLYVVSDGSEGNRRRLSPRADDAER